MPENQPAPGTRAAGGASLRVRGGFSRAAQNRRSSTKQFPRVTEQIVGYPVIARRNGPERSEGSNPLRFPVPRRGLLRGATASRPLAMTARLLSLRGGTTKQSPPSP